MSCFLALNTFQTEVVVPEQCNIEKEKYKQKLQSLDIAIAPEGDIALVLSIKGKTAATAPIYAALNLMMAGRHVDIDGLPPLDSGDLPAVDLNSIRPGEVGEPLL